MMQTILLNLTEGGLIPAGLKGLTSAGLKAHAYMQLPFKFEANHLQITFKEICTLKEMTEA